jgi:uncharacterized repeat protein (TIGR03803 family)
MQGVDGNFYGVTQGGGSAGSGIIFRLSVPMPPVFQTVSQTNGTITFIWSAVATQIYQVQYNTDLNSTNWNNLGSTITATNATAVASDSIGSDSQRFYRALLLP